MSPGRDVSERVGGGRQEVPTQRNDRNALGVRSQDTSRRWC